MSKIENLTDAEIALEQDRLDGERQMLRKRGRLLKEEIARRSIEDAIASKLLYGSQLSAPQEAYWNGLLDEGRGRVKAIASSRVAAAQKVIETRVEKL